MGYVLCKFLRYCLSLTTPYHIFSTLPYVRFSPDGSGYTAWLGGVAMAWFGVATRLASDTQSLANAPHKQVDSSGQQDWLHITLRLHTSASSVSSVVK